MKILYAASNRDGAHLQLNRFLSTIDKSITVKVAAYKHLCKDLPIDWNLDSLLNFSNVNDNISFSNDNYRYYAYQVKKYSPDLIISDLEIYTSNIAFEFGIKVWQASPLLLYYAVSNNIKNEIGIYKKYSILFEKNWKKKNYINFIINNSDKNFVISHFCDIKEPPILKDNFKWVRPEFELSDSNNIKYDYLGVSSKKNIDMLKYMRFKKSIYYSTNDMENYPNISLQNINSKRYCSDIGKCKFILSEGDEVFLADAFYNQKYSILFPRIQNVESIVNSYFSEYFGLGSIIFNLTALDYKKPDIILNDKVKFLSQHLGEI